jgi:acetyl esterase/lipase
MTLKRRSLLITLLAVTLLACGLLPASPPVNGKMIKDVSYGRADGESLLLDVYLPENLANQLYPMVVFIHGGGWSAGSKEDFADLAAGLAKQGYVTFSINYRLVKNGQNRFPAGYDDVQRAIRWVRAHAADYHGDPNRVAVLGGSAGGQLVALLGTTETRDNTDPSLAAFSSRPQCVIDLFGPADLTRPFPQKSTEGLNVQQLVYDYMGGRPEEKVDAYRQASPIFHINSTSVPFLIFQGTDDDLVPVDQSRQFAAALKLAGVDVEYVEFQGEGHGFQKKETQDVFVKRTLEFLKNHLK